MHPEIARALDPKGAAEVKVQTSDALFHYHERVLEACIKTAPYLAPSSLCMVVVNVDDLSNLGLSAESRDVLSDVICAGSKISPFGYSYAELDASDLLLYLRAGLRELRRRQG